MSWPLLLLSNILTTHHYDVYKHNLCALHSCIVSDTHLFDFSNSRTTVTSVVELPTPLTDNSKQLIISLQCEDITSTICVFHINGSQILRCIQTDLVVTELAVCDEMPDGPFTCFDGVVMAGTKTGEIFVFDLNRAGLIQGKHV